MWQFFDPLNRWFFQNNVCKVPIVEGVGKRKIFRGELRRTGQRNKIYFGRFNSVCLFLFSFVKVRALRGKRKICNILVKGAFGGLSVAEILIP